VPAIDKREAVAVAVTQLGERIDQRRKNEWHIYAIRTAWDRKRNRERLDERYAQKWASGEYIRDELLPELRHDKTMNLMGRKFINAAESGTTKIVRCYIEEGFPANWQDPLTGATALHGAASTRARPTLRVLVESGRCDFLLRDKQGRLASEMAFLYGDDPAAARWLRIHERRQAAARGISLARRPKAPPT
jgi:hypothetical protein